MANKYRFLEIDENGKECHRHQIRLIAHHASEWADMTGASTIVGILDKPGLTWWASSLAVKKLGWLNPKETTKTDRILHAQEARGGIVNGNDEDYLALLDDAYKAHSVRLAESAEAGTDLHTLLEEYVKACIYNNESKPMELIDEKNHHVLKFSKFACEHIKRFNWSEAHMYDEDLFIGGISDCGVTMKDGSYAIIDFKSSKEAYFSHFCQIALYHILFEKNGICTKNGDPLSTYVFPISKYYVIPFGAKEFTVYENNNIKELKEAALACVKIYRTKSNFSK